jgi:hypothetical protein
MIVRRRLAPSRDGIITGTENGESTYALRNSERVA